MSGPQANPSEDDQTFPPSYFANLGQPCCSRWGKSEIEWIALAYVRALANDGDTWKRLPKERVWELLTEEQRTSPLYAVLGMDVELRRDFYDHWFQLVADQITDSEGAFGVRGFWYRPKKPVRGYLGSTPDGGIDDGP